MIWFTGDQHWGHERIIEYCEQPFQGVEEIAEILERKE